MAVYVVVGAAFSGSLLGAWFPFSLEPWSPVLTEVALGIIAYLVGAEIHLKEVHRQEKAVFAAAIGQLLGVLLLVSSLVWLYGQWVGRAMQLDAAFVIGSIATATAPAATIAVINEYRARGKVSDILLGVVAVDDALGIIAFTFALGLLGQNLASHLWMALFEIAGSIALGSLMGAILGMVRRKIHEDDLRLPVVLAAVFVTTVAAQVLGLSMLLSCMVLGLVSKVLFEGKTEQWLLPIHHIREVIFLVFFLLAGLHFDPRVFFESLGLILVYVAARVFGKLGGAAVATSLAGATHPVVKYLGPCLLPQAGVAIGLALKAAEHPELQPMASILMNTVLGSTLLFELTAPLVTRWALRKAGDIP